ANFTFVESWRERHPSSYSLKIKNISQLNKSIVSSNERYQSRLFASGGFNWRLLIYPKGNAKDEGSGFISMYVEIDSKSLMETPPNEVYAGLTFFVYNKKENSYYTVRDAEVKHFNALKMVWGLSQVISLDTFNDPKKGYIFEGDECEFGVDVDVSPPLTSWEILSFCEKLPSPKFSMAIKNFSDLKEYLRQSNIFSMGEMNWVLKLYPKGTTADGKWLSIFLCVPDGETLKEDEEIYIRAHIRVLDPLGFNHLKDDLKVWFNKSTLSWGFPQYVSTAEIRKTYLD
ncbi:hypothetical protein EUTSA_v10028326mg, partial [Eutrema salsugineum]